jgi:hypothetical protein
MTRMETTPGVRATVNRVTDPAIHAGVAVGATLSMVPLAVHPAAGADGTVPVADAATVQAVVDDTLLRVEAAIAVMEAEVEAAVVAAITQAASGPSTTSPSTSRM